MLARHRIKLPQDDLADLLAGLGARVLAGDIEISSPPQCFLA